jgi:hypothetical protein
MWRDLRATFFFLNIFPSPLGEGTGVGPYTFPITILNKLPSGQYHSLRYNHNIQIDWFSTLKRK